MRLPVHIPRFRYFVTTLKHSAEYCGTLDTSDDTIMRTIVIGFKTGYDLKSVFISRPSEPLFFEEVSYLSTKSPPLFVVHNFAVNLA